MNRPSLDLVPVPDANLPVPAPALPQVSEDDADDDAFEQMIADIEAAKDDDTEVVVIRRTGGDD